MVIARAQPPRSTSALGVRLSGVPALVLVTGGLLIAALVIFGPLAAPYNSTQMDVSHALESPSATHLLGTDDLGRDYLSRLLAGGRNTILAAVAIAVLALVVGGVIGFVSAYLASWPDAVITRVLDALMVFPGLLLALIAVTILGPGLVTAVIAVALTEVPPTARMARATMLKEKSAEYVDSSRMAGCGAMRVFVQHLIPNSLGPVIVQGSLIAADAIIIVAALGYLGLGAQPPTPEWGLMLSASQSYINVDPFLAVPPGIAIALVALFFFSSGEYLRTRFALR